ncbi:hypothetical protein FBUS_10023 [Fasciolopsis buskii]|uniref:EF-hand domain-containing protein n=1 Tax=Fasciolopsis buskii TaxID=27845 RepID=A0A8E0RL87_9TREM|nr:hypothetical protein FBUS_10023 [Fasciolopsis buski]
MSVPYEKRKALLRRFHQMDRNGDGILTVDEVRRVVQLSGLPESAVQITECPSAQEPIRTRSRLRVHRCLDPHRASAAIICKRHPLDSISTSR